MFGTLRTVFLCVFASGTFALFGCQAGHGQYTSAHLDVVTARMSEMKAGTSWDMAHQQYLAGDLAKAIRTIDDSLSHKEGVARTHALRGQIQMELGRLDGAFVSFERALDLDADYTDAHYYLGILHERFRAYDKALRCYESAFSLDPGNPQYILAAAEMRVELGRVDGARAYLLAHQRSFMNNAGVRQALGQIATLQSRYSDAVALFREARLLAPDDISVLEDLARAEAGAGQWSEAQHHLRQLLGDESYTARRDLHHLFAQSLKRLGRPVEAREVLHSLTRSEEGAADSWAWAELGEVELQLGNANAARRAARRLLHIVPESPAGYALSAAIKLDAEDLVGALVDLDNAVDRSMDDPNPALLRGVVLSQLGRETEAQESFDLAASIDPGSALVRRALAGVSEGRDILE